MSPLRFDPPKLLNQLREVYQFFDDVAYFSLELPDEEDCEKDASSEASSQPLTNTEDLEEIPSSDSRRLFKKVNLDLDETISLDTEITISPHSSHDYDVITIGELLDMVEEIKAGKLKNREIFFGKNYSLIHLNPGSEVAQGLIYDDDITVPEVEAEVEIQKAKLSCSLFQGSYSPFWYYIGKEDKNSRDSFPAYSENHLFLRIEHNTRTKIEEVYNTAYAFLFELSCYHSLTLHPLPYPEAFWGYDEQEYPDHAQNLQLTVSEKLSTLYRLFLEADSAESKDLALVQFVKTIEYVSASVVRLTIHAALLGRLQTREALRPNAAFLDSVIKLVEAHQIVRGSDRDSLRLTLQHCCDPEMLTPLVPKQLKKFQALSKALEDGGRQKKAKAIATDAMDELAGMLTSTRNQLVHAKANYKPTGAECPPEQLPELVLTARKVSLQVIRWYANQPQHVQV